MGLRIRKSWGAGPVRFNLSKSGIGGSIGVKGARLTRTANGRTRSTLSIPGSGISYVTESSGKRKRSNKNSGPTNVSTHDYVVYKHLLSVWKVLVPIAWIVGIPTFLLGLLSVTSFPSVGIPLVLLGGFLIYCAKWLSKKQTAKMKKYITEFEDNIVCGVRNKETGEIFSTLEAAAASIDQKSSASISRSIGQGTKAGGYHWEFVTRKQLAENGN